MDLRKSFDTEVLNYDRWRPRYCKELFADLIEYSGLDSGKECLEIGCGTGQATEPLLKTGSSLLAIELGEHFTEFTRNKFKSYGNFQIMNADFEQLDLEPGRFDLVFSGTAFHWIKEEIGYPKAYHALKSGGALALFWNRPGPPSLSDPLHLKLQEVYGRHFSPEKNRETESDRQNPHKRYAAITGTIEKYGFLDAECRLYQQVREFNADDYVSLLGTYSDHIALPEPAKSRLFTEIRDVICEFGNTIKVYDTIDLYLARKP